MDADELAGCLRSWRDRLKPADGGLPAGTARRAPGLRREEVAMLAGLSVDYLARLEQGRASHPEAAAMESGDVLTADRSGLRLVVYTAGPGSPDASALEMIRALGLQSFTATTP